MTRSVQSSLRDESICHWRTPSCWIENAAVLPGWNRWPRKRSCRISKRAQQIVLCNGTRAEHLGGGAGGRARRGRQIRVEAKGQCIEVECIYRSVIVEISIPECLPASAEVGGQGVEVQRIDATVVVGVGVDEVE